MRRVLILATAAILALLSPVAPQAQPIGVVVGSTPVVGGTNGQCLSISSGKVGSAACSGGGGGITINSTTVTGGTSGAFLYDKAGTVGQSAFGTLTASTPITLSQTWNNAAVTFNAMVIDVTDTAVSNVGPPFSMAFDVRRGGSSQLSIGVDGWFYPRGSFALMGASNDGQSLNFYQVGDPVHQIRGIGFFTRQGRSFGWGPSDAADKPPIVAFTGVDTGIVELNNGSPTSGSGTYAQINLATTQLAPATAPGSPALSGSWVLYVDSGDGNKLKAKASTGTVVTLGTP